MPLSTDTPNRASKVIAFVAIDDRAFAEQGLPMVRVALAAGLQAVVIVRAGAHRPEIEASGARVVPIAFDSGRFNPMTSGYAAGQLSGILKALETDIVHAVGLGPILVGGTAAAMAGIANRIYSLDGLGRYGDRRDAIGSLSRMGLKAVLRGALAGRRTRFVFDRAEDARALGLDPLDTAVRIVGTSAEDGLEPTLRALYAEFGAT